MTDWTIPINWQDRVEKSYEYATEIIQSRNGKEQRIATRQTPREYMIYSTWQNGESRRDMDILGDLHQTDTFMVPDVGRITHTPGDTGLSNYFRVRGAPQVWMEPGSTFVAVSGLRMGFFTVFTHSYAPESDTTDLYPVEAMGPSWPRRTRIMAAVESYLTQSFNTQNITSEVASYRCVFDAVPGKTPFPEPAYVLPMHKGFPVFLTRHNWASALDQNFEHPTELVDYGTGRIARHRPIPFGTRVTRHRFTGVHERTIPEVLDMFHRCRGQQGEFYRPTFLRDFFARTAIEAGQSTIRLRGQKILAYASSTVFRNLTVWTRGHGVHHRRIVSMTPVSDALGEDTIILFDSPWAESVALQNIRTVEWLLRNRFASDNLSLTFAADTRAETQVTIRTLEDLAL